MAKLIASEIEIQNMIQERILNSDELGGDCREVFINSVYWHEPDEEGSNWDVSSFRNAHGCEGIVNKIVAVLKKQYNLEDK